MRPTLPTLRQALPESARQLLDAAIEAAETTDKRLWVVGGALRDLAAGLPLRDVDLASAGDAALLAAEVARRVGGETRDEPRFGTASVRLGDHRLDIASLRTETYARPGALPTVRLGATIEDDLARRDFTVNAVALEVVGTSTKRIVDPFNGLADLEARRLRVLHDRSFIEDATRLWRGARFAARLRLRPEPHTAALIEDGGRWLTPISARRLWAEFEHTAAEARIGAACALLDRWGILEATHPEFRLAPEARRAVARRRGPLAVELLLAVLLGRLREPSQRGIEARLGAPRTATSAVADASRLLALPDCDPDTLETVAATSEAGRTAAEWLDPPRQRRLQRALRRWERARSPLDAAALMQLGVAAGPELGRALHGLRRARYLGTLGGAADVRRQVESWTAEERTGA